MTHDDPGAIAAESDSGAESAPVRAADIQVIKGNPTDEEVAALVIALGAAAPRAGTQDLAPRNRWAEPVDMLRYSPHSWQRVTLYERTKLAR